MTFKKKEWLINVLVLDDQPAENRTNFIKLLEGIGAEQGSAQDSPRWRNRLTIDWAYQEVIVLDIVFLGIDKGDMLDCLRNAEFMSRFELVVVDLRWNKMDFDPLVSGDFGVFSDDFKKLTASKAGLLISRFTRSLWADPVTIMVSHDTIDRSDIKAAIESGVFQFISKHDPISLFNILVVVMERMRARARQAIDESAAAPPKGATTLKGLLDRLDLPATSFEAKLLRALPEPNAGTIESTDLAHRVDLSTAEHLEQRVGDMIGKLHRHGIRLVLEDGKYRTELE